MKLCSSDNHYTTEAFSEKRLIFQRLYYCDVQKDFYTREILSFLSCDKVDGR